MKKYLSLLLVVLLLFVNGGQTFAQFGENPGEIKTFGQVLQEVGLIKGDGSGLNPKAYLSREELVTIINRLYREEAPEFIFSILMGEYGDYGSVESPSTRDAPSQEYKSFTPPVKATFTDVPKSHWAYKDVEFAYEKGISKGISSKEFGLGQKVNANQAALFLIRIMGYDDKIIEEKINYNDAYRKVSLLLNIKGSQVKDPLDPLLRGDVFQMVYDSLWARTPQGKTPEGIFFVYEVFGQETEMWWKVEKILGGDSYCCYYEMHDILPPDEPYYTSFLPIFKTKEDLFAGYLDLKANKITKTFDMAYYKNLKDYLVDLNKAEEGQSGDYTNAMLIQMLKRDNNIFVKTLEDITSEEIQEISWKEFEKLVGSEVNCDLDMWTPYGYSENEYEYLNPNRAKALVSIDPLNSNFEFTYDKPAGEGMDWVYESYQYEVKKILVDKKTQTKFIFTFKIADDEYQDLDLFFAFEYDPENEMIVKAASSNTRGFGVLNLDNLMNNY